jgi:hypothetical protein
MGKFAVGQTVYCTMVDDLRTTCRYPIRSGTVAGITTIETKGHIEIYYDVTGIGVVRDRCCHFTIHEAKECAYKALDLINEQKKAMVGAY